MILYTQPVGLTEWDASMVGQICKFACNFSHLSGRECLGHTFFSSFLFSHLPFETFVYSSKALPVWTIRLQRWCVVGRDNICNYWTPRKALNKTGWKKAEPLTFASFFSPLEQFSFTRAKWDEVNNDNLQRGIFKAMATEVIKVQLSIYYIVPEILPLQLTIPIVNLQNQCML